MTKGFLMSICLLCETLEVAVLYKHIKATQVGK